MKFTILGGGIAGLTTAIALEKKGFKTEIFEAAPQLKPVGAGLALGANAIKALTKLGIADDIIAAGRKLPSFGFYNHKGTLLSQVNSDEISQQYGLDNFTIHRAALHQQLQSHLPYTPLHLNKRAIGYTQNGEDITIQFADGSTHTTQYLIVADGIHSAIRKQLLPQVALRYAGYVCWRAVINGEGIDAPQATETFGPKGRFGIAPLANNLIYWYACTNAPEDTDVYPNYTIEQLRQHFAGYHNPIEEILARTTNEQLIYGTIADLPPQPRFAFGNILLIGDAAHATTPNMGQGACQAIEDAVVLADELAKNTTVTTAYANFENRRCNRTKYIVEQSRKIGQVAQWQNPVLGFIRDTLVKSLPKSARMKQFDKLFTVDF